MSAASGQSFWAVLMQRLGRWFGGPAEANLRESIEDVLEEVGDEDVGFSDEERHMLRNLLGFRDLRVDDVMVPRADIQAVDITTTADALLARFSAVGHSRMPVFRDTLDNPVGMLHVKHALAAFHNGARASNEALPAVESLVRDVLFVPPSMPCLDLLLKMQATRTHLALVIDEYGGTDGLVTIENLIEEIIGEIEDDENTAPDLLEQRSAQSWRAQARLPLDELQDALNLPFAELDIATDIDSLGGLVFTIAGRVPTRGEMIAYQFADGQRVEFVIRDGDPRRVKTVDIKIATTPTSAPTG